MKPRNILLNLALAATAAAAQQPQPTEAELTSAPVDSLVAAAVAANSLPDLLRHAENVLFSPLSPLMDEQRLALILSRALETETLPDDLAETAHWMLNDVCLVNAPGTPAANISLQLADGTITDLADYLPAQQLAIIFYDPDCRHCRQVMAQLDTLASKTPVLAICIESTRKRWQETAPDIAARGWTPAFDLSKVTETDQFVIRALPSIYLLDANRRVILKNPTPERLLQTLEGGRP